MDRPPQKKLKERDTLNSSAWGSSEDKQTHQRTKRTRQEGACARRRPTKTPQREEFSSFIYSVYMDTATTRMVV